MRRRAALCACLTLMVLTLSGCLGGQDIRERALIQLMGIDYREGGYHLTLQIFSPTGQNETEGGEEQHQLVRASGPTLSEALRDASLRVGRAAFLGDTRAMVIGEETAATHLGDILRFLTGNDEVYPQMVLLVAAGEAGDIVGPKTEENQQIVASSLEHITGSAVVKEALCPSDLLTIARSHYARGAGSALLRVRRQDEEELVLFVPDGVALFVGEVSVGRLDDSAHRGMLALRGLGKGSLFEVEDQELGRVALQIKRIRTRVRTDMGESGPRFFIDVRAELLPVELSDNPAARLTEDDRNRLTQLGSAAIRRDAEAAIAEASAAGSDVFGFYRYLKRDQSAYWRERADRWPELMDSAVYQVSVTTTLGRIGD